MWAVGWSGVGNESSPRAFVEFGEHPISQRLKGPANAVLTGKRQCQPGGKQGAENQRGGHGKGAPWGEEERSGRHRRGAASSGSVVAGWRFLRSINMPRFSQEFSDSLVARIAWRRSQGEGPPPKRRGTTAAPKFWPAGSSGLTNSGRRDGIFWATEVAPSVNRSSADKKA
jgi:hypothetical protein